MLRLSPKSTQLDHGESEIEAITLCLLYNLFVQLKARLVLRSVGRNEPTIVSNGNKYADLHFKNLWNDLEMKKYQGNTQGQKQDLQK
jgi:hypothetical protein